MDIVDKIKKLYEQNNEDEVTSIIKYDNAYWVLGGGRYGSILTKYEVFDDEPKQTLIFASTLDGYGEEIMDKGILLYRNNIY